MGIKKEHKKALIENLEAGDLIVLGNSIRLVRAVEHDNVQHKDKGQLKFYFAKIRRSGYPSCFTVYERAILEENFGGLVKRGVPLRNTVAATLVQDAIEVWIEETDSEKSREIITEDESVGLVI